MLTAFIFENDKLPITTTSLDDVLTAARRDDAMLWVDLESPEESLLLQIGEIFGLDEESMDDCLHGEQRPRLDEFEAYLFLVLYGLFGVERDVELTPRKLAVFCGERFLITVHRQPLMTVRQVRERCKRHSDAMLREGLDAVLFALIDLTVDHYMDVADQYETRVEDLEDRSFQEGVDESLLSDAADVRRELLELRRLATSQRQLLLPVAQGHYDYISDRLSLRFRHVRDHLAEVRDTIDSLRELLVGVRDNYHAMLADRTNEIVKTLTIYAGILLPLSVITGIYGMNVPLWPAPNQQWTFWFVVGCMMAVSVGLFWYFRRKRWM